MLSHQLKFSKWVSKLSTLLFVTIMCWILYLISPMKKTLLLSEKQTNKSIELLKGYYEHKMYSNAKTFEWWCVFPTNTQILQIFVFLQHWEQSFSRFTQVFIIISGISAFSHVGSPMTFKEYNSAQHQFIFIGGHPRSGTTLVRAMLDSHHLVRRE